MWNNCEPRDRVHIQTLETPKSLLFGQNCGFVPIVWKTFTDTFMWVSELRTVSLRLSPAHLWRKLISAACLHDLKPHLLSFSCIKVISRRQLNTHRHIITSSTDTNQYWDCGGHIWFIVFLASGTNIISIIIRCVITAVCVFTHYKQCRTPCCFSLKEYYNIFCIQFELRLMFVFSICCLGRKYKDRSVSQRNETRRWFDNYSTIKWNKNIIKIWVN